MHQRWAHTHTSLSWHYRSASGRTAHDPRAVGDTHQIYPGQIAVNSICRDIVALANNCLQRHHVATAVSTSAQEPAVAEVDRLSEQQLTVSVMVPSRR